MPPCAALVLRRSPNAFPFGGCFVVCAAVMQESESRAHPITVAGDVLSDLQEVDNFAEVGAEWPRTQLTLYGCVACLCSGVTVCMLTATRCVYKGVRQTVLLLKKH